MHVIPELEPDAIRAAQLVIDPVFRDAPQHVHDGLSARLGAPVIVKIETINPIRSFKGRGTWVAVRALAADGSIGPDRPVICASAGNFGQGVAYAARALGIPAIVFASRRANRAKVARMRALGAEVIEVGDDFDDARGASEVAAADGAGWLLVDGDDPRISTGAATLAVEITDAVGTGALPSPVVARRNSAAATPNAALIDDVRSPSPGRDRAGAPPPTAAAMPLRDQKAVGSKPCCPASGPSRPTPSARR